MEKLIVKYLEDRATDSEKRLLLEWLRKKENRKTFDFHRSLWEQSVSERAFPEAGVKTWHLIESEMLRKSHAGWQRSLKLTGVFRYAAIFFFLLTLTFSLLWYFQGNRHSEDISTHIMADNGQISRASLPDGTGVWINSGSAISYNSGFGVKNRAIHLTGEAYFEAAKGNRHPLEVNTGDLIVRVTGTRFNVSAAQGSHFITVILEEGEVDLLRPQNASFRYALKPGEMAIFDLADKKMTVSTVNTRRFTSWKEGIINIYEQTLEEVAEKLKIRYNQEFVVSPEVKDYHYTFTVKNESLQEIITLIEKITPVKAVQEGNTITFRKRK